MDPHQPRASQKVKISASSRGNRTGTRRTMLKKLYIRLIRTLKSKSSRSPFPSNGIIYLRVLDHFQASMCHIRASIVRQ